MQTEEKSECSGAGRGGAGSRNWRAKWGETGLPSESKTVGVTADSTGTMYLLEVACSGTDSAGLTSKSYPRPDARFENDGGTFEQR